MVPDTSRPGTGLPSWMVPDARWLQSWRLTPADATRINASPAFGCGIGAAATCSTDGSPAPVILMTVCSVDIGALPLMVDEAAICMPDRAQQRGSDPRGF